MPCLNMGEQSEPFLAKIMANNFRLLQGRAHSLPECALNVACTRRDSKPVHCCSASAPCG